MMYHRSQFLSLECKAICDKGGNSGGEGCCYVCYKGTLPGAGMPIQGRGEVLSYPHVSLHVAIITNDGDR